MTDDKITETVHEILIEVIDPTRSEAYAEIKPYTFPDGMVKHDLNPDQLREVAETLTDVADRMEDHE